jgi:tRNA threonylcarbamoyladenosine modification (KEOPS) complex Cgi121 subunit
MLVRSVVEFDKVVAVLGLVDVKPFNLEDVLTRVRGLCRDVEVQLLSPQCLAGFDHIFFASLNALKSFKQGRSISKSLAMELVVYASAQRQIEKAIRYLGVKDAEGSVVIVALGSDEERVISCVEAAAAVLDGRIQDSVVDIVEEEKLEHVKRFFGITDVEVEAVRRSGESEGKVVERLIVERMAILSTMV